VAKTEFAPGLPDPRRFGSVTDLPKGRELLYVIQRHLADRAGPHYDIRFGPNLGGKPSLLSWASRKLPEESGQKVLAFQQPLHTGAYANFEGEITSGYGKGLVKTHDKGTVLVTKVEPNKINFVVTHKKHPEMYTMIRKSGPPTGGSPRTKKTQGGSWLMINTTPTEVIKHKKVRYAKVPAEDVEKLFDEKYLHMEKIDGAAALYKLFSDKIDVLSYRPTTTGRPIVHTYRVGGTTGLNIPKHLVGSILRGELYGTRDDRAIPPQELGGILNSSTRKSLKKQREQGVQLRNAIFNILKYGKKPIGMDVPIAERLDKVREILKHLPEGKFHLPRMAETPEEQRALWEDVKGGRDPLTHEGIVAWPKKGGKPAKVKLYDEHDVFVKDIFPGEKRLEGVGAGGFEYSLSPDGPAVGKVGTGFSEDLRRAMLKNPEEFLGRIARIKAQGQFPSGAYRAPGLISIHEDYPDMRKASDYAGILLKEALWPFSKKEPDEDEEQWKEDQRAVDAGAHRFDDDEEDSIRLGPLDPENPEAGDIYMNPKTGKITILQSIFEHAASVDWDKVHESAGLLKQAFLGGLLGGGGPQKPAWMGGGSPAKPHWMGGPAPAKPFGLRENLLSMLLGTKPQSIRDTGNILDTISSIMGYFRGAPAAQSPGSPFMR